jgi:ubiquitin C-terminal hydrolase
MCVYLLSKIFFVKKEFKKTIHIKVMRITVFSNLGNTCYLNAVLQCFLYNPEFQKCINQSENKCAEELKKIISKIDLTPNEEYNAIFCNTQSLFQFFNFRRFEQQDAHECILKLLEVLETELKGIYYGETKTCIVCLKCKGTKNVLEEFNSINLSITSDNLTDIFMKYLEKETHTDPESLYYCEHCKSNQTFEKKISLNKLPSTLILILKRYTFTGSKILSEVSFGDTLTIRESITGDIKRYNLSSVINHSGNLYNGHYTNFKIINGKCLFIDDQRVGIKEYDCKDAYVLFYDQAISS